jgi:hypothetical protein
MSTQETAEVINDAIADPVPHMPDAPNSVIDLMRGVYDPSIEKWHSQAEIRELTGEDEEYLASIENKKGLLYAEYMTAILNRAVVRIGDISISGAEGAKVINKLILGDRDLLYLAVVKATYGDERTIKMTCNNCNGSNDVTLELDNDFPITSPTFDLQKGLEVEISSETVTLRLPNGEDTVEVSKNSKNDAEMNTLMLSRCAVWSDGNKPDSPVKWARSLSIKDRKKLVDALLSVEVGPKMGEVDTQCASCGETMPILLDWVSLLFS